jgi:7,8-didemethyl-8-hydroxy-5-deazariboflavin synthase CofH subunit
LTRSLEGQRLSEADVLTLLGVVGEDLRALIAVADRIRRDEVGDVVTYVVNRNINFTNVCFVNCQFCAFKRQRWEGDAYNHGVDRVLEKVAEATERGATEICMQGGINPQMGAFTYRDMLIAIKSKFPDIHMHAFSPMEILYGSRRTNMPYSDYLAMLRDAGLGSVPGTAAEILDDEVREILSHKKVDVATWVEIIGTAHRLGIPSTATIMYGHVEKPAHIAAHLALVRRLQGETEGFTEFVPLRFIHQNTMLYQRGLVQPLEAGAPDLRVYAICRLFFRGSIDNLQTSWVKLGHELAALSLAAGVNDFGGTLMEESISREAGADAGEYTPVEEIERLIRSMGRVPRQRTTLYHEVGPGHPHAAAPTPAAGSLPELGA